MVAWKSSVLALLGMLALTSARKGFKNPFFDAATLTFVAMSEDDMHRIPNPVRLHGPVPGASIVVRAPAPAPVEFGETPRLPESQTNFSLYLTLDKQFDICFFLNLNVPGFPEAPDFRVKKNGQIVVENADFKRLSRKVQEQQRRLAEGNPPSFEEMNEELELPEDFYPLKGLDERCLTASPMGNGRYLVSATVEVDYPLRLFGGPVPMLELSTITSDNRPNVTEIVDKMKTQIERGVRMMRTFGPPVPPMPGMPGMPPSLPFGMPPPPGAAGPGPLAFPGGPFQMGPPPPAAMQPRPESQDPSTTRFTNRNSQSSQGQSSGNQWLPANPFQASSSNRQANPWVPQMQGNNNNNPLRNFRGVQK